MSSDLAPPDPLGDRPKEGPDRPHYAVGVMLDADDFRTEQNYHRGRLARGLKYLFGTGTVVGLFVDRRPDAGETEEVVVRPGIALDPLGRLIEVPRSACVHIGRWWEAQTDDALTAGFHAVAPAPFGGVSGVLVDVFVKFEVCPRGRTPAFASGPFDATDALQPHRLRDGYHLDLVIRSEADPNRPPDSVALGVALGADAAAFRTRVYASWQDADDQWRDDMPPALPEHATGMDTRSVLLARLLIPANAPGDALGRPDRRLGDSVLIENDVRRFVYAPGLLAWVAP